jgi:three-Cys-motif partner protein
LAKRKGFEQVEELPFPDGLPEKRKPKILFKNLRRPLWTENKAKLIERYLLYFVYITKHGTYIDGFAGPQEPDKPEMWAAKLVLDNEPKWMRHFYLFDENRQQIKYLEELKRSQPLVWCDAKGHKYKRDIQVKRGDFNLLVRGLLDSKEIRQKEATFCLLDQRTFECQWSTVKALAEYKEPGENKIELFYFLPNSWQDRAISALRNDDILKEWWGRDDWSELRTMHSMTRRALFVDRFEQELGYKSVVSWPIYDSPAGRRIMYYMIHATDHDEAPKQMERAYNNAVKPKESPEQLEIEFG